MAEAVDIGTCGEQIVVNDLKRKGYNVKWDTKGPGSTDIEAHGEPNSYLIQVKTAVIPNEPADLSSDERRNITSRAARLRYIPRLAKVRLYPNGMLFGAIGYQEP
jgi:hypothetical protein